MTHYLISFASSGMDHIPREEFDDLVRTSHEVVEAAKEAGVYVFGGGIDEQVAPVRVAADGTVTHDTYRETAELAGGFLVLDLPDREAALEWAARVAKGCRCPQEVRAFQYDPHS